MAHLIDSSVWVALFLDFDTQHAKAERVVAKLSGAIYLPYCVILEVATVLAYKHSKQLADNFIAYARDNRDIVIINDDAVEEMAFYITIPYNLAFVDISLMLLSKKHNATLVTFDKQLERAAKEVLSA